MATGDGRSAISRIDRERPWWCGLIVLATISPTIAPSEQMVVITNTDMFGQLDISGCREAEPERERPGRERPTTCPSYLIVYFKVLKVCVKLPVDLIRS